MCIFISERAGIEVRMHLCLIKLARPDGVLALFPSPHLSFCCSFHLQCEKKIMEYNLGTRLMVFSAIRWEMETEMQLPFCSVSSQENSAILMHAFLHFIFFKYWMSSYFHSQSVRALPNGYSTVKMVLPTLAVCMRKLLLAVEEACP